MDPDAPPDGPDNPARVRRAKALGAISLVAVAIACVAYLRPASTAQAVPVPSASPGYQLDAVDFVDPSTGWVLVDLTFPELAVLGTTDAGRHWTVRLVVPSRRHGEYMRLFDRSNGVVAVTGAQASVLETRDGGAHWTRHPVDLGGAYGISASFADMDHGWILALSGSAAGDSSTSLMRTMDGGATWTGLGAPVALPTEAFGITFIDRERGWLDAECSGPFAWSTDDAGSTWRRVALPAPRGGWPTPHNSFFVAPRPTPGGGVIATVVTSASFDGRFGSRSAAVGHSPPTVRTFEGVWSIHLDSTSSDSPGSILHVEDDIHKPGPAASVQPAPQVGLSSADGGVTWSVFKPPGAGGTIGYADAVRWWWVGPGLQSTSADGGATWSPLLAGGVADPVPGSLEVIDETHAWVGGIVGRDTDLFATSDGGLHWTEVALPQITATQLGEV